MDGCAPHLHQETFNKMTKCSHVSDVKTSGNIQRRNCMNMDHHGVHRLPEGQGRNGITRAQPWTVGGGGGGQVV